MGEFKLVQVRNPHYLGEIAPFINNFVEKIQPYGITYQSLWTYFSQSVQLGGDRTEFWVVLNESDEPVAFAHWFVMALPHVGKVCCDYIYSWNRMSEPVSMLMDKFIEFGKRNNSPMYEGHAANDVLYRVWRKAAYKKKMGIKPTGIVNFVGRKEWAAAQN